MDVCFLLPPFTVVRQGEDFWWRNVPQPWIWSAHALYGVCLAFYFLVLLRHLPERSVSTAAAVG